jgi:dinuclear metal center YbgI/SA1388 family protein
MEVEEFVDIVKRYLPFEVGFENDKIGIQISSSRNRIQKILITYEITPQVVDEAIQKDADLIVSFHPLIYFPLNSILYTDRVGQIVQQLIKASISVVVLHTNFDAFRGGTSWLFAERLNIGNLDFLVPNKEYPNFGFGVVGEYEEPLKYVEFLGRIQNITYSPLRWCEGKTKFVKKVAIVGGSGMNFAPNAYLHNADAFITADIKYHSFHEYKGKMMLVDPGHWEMEYLVPDGLKNLLTSIFKEELSLFVSTIYTNPVNYYAGEEFNELQKKLLNK